MLCPSLPRLLLVSVLSLYLVYNCAKLLPNQTLLFFISGNVEFPVQTGLATQRSI
jgi:hypothetical protein